jgi:hypothetical protein
LLQEFKVPLTERVVSSAAKVENTYQIICRPHRGATPTNETGVKSLSYLIVSVGKCFHLSAVHNRGI